METEKIMILMPLSGRILWDMYGESFGYFRKPPSLHVPLEEHEINKDWIQEIERGVIYLQK